MAKHLPLLIIGAGTYGLAMSAYAGRKNIEHVVVGKTMDFWKSNMPEGMHLRSACDWHYDPFNEATIERYLETKNLKRADVEPLALAFYLSYAEWFVKQKRGENGVKSFRTFPKKSSIKEGQLIFIDQGLNRLHHSSVIAV